MSTGFWLTLIVYALVALVVGLVIVFGAGLRAVTKHPGEYDPARNAKRYTVPAVVGLVLALFGSAAFMIALAGVIVSALIL